MTVPGLVQPTVSSMNGPTPQASAAAQGNAANQKLALMNNKLAGGRRKKWRGGANGTVVVPQFKMGYTPQNGPNQDPNAQIKDLSAISTQSAANAEYDNLATKMGGRRKKKGGNPDWNWGCYSGGRRTRRRTRRTKRAKRSKTKRSRKSRR